MVEDTKRKNRKTRPATHNILLRTTTNDPNQTYCTLKLNCIEKNIKLRRVDYPNTDSRFF
jgi:hypothetical protein